MSTKADKSPLQNNIKKSHSDSFLLCTSFLNDAHVSPHYAHDHLMKLSSSDAVQVASQLQHYSTNP